MPWKKDHESTKRSASPRFFSSLLGHLFWPDLLSWTADDVLQAELLLHHGQITDTDLLAHAVHQRCCRGAMLCFA
jgi:hypothetical protein